MFGSKRGEDQSAFNHSAIDFLTVMLVVIIPLITTAPSLSSASAPDVVKTEAQQQASGQTKITDFSLVKVSRNGLFVDDIPSPSEQLLSTLAGLNTSVVYLQCEDNVDFGQCRRVLNALNQSGLYHTSIVTDD